MLPQVLGLLLVFERGAETGKLFVPSDASLVPLDVSIFLNASALWGVDRIVVSSLAHVRAHEWLLDCFCRLALCLCIELSTCFLRTVSVCLCSIGACSRFLCCLPSLWYSVVGETRFAHASI